MKKDIEHVVTSTTMFVIAFLLSASQEPDRPAKRSRRRPGPSFFWFIGVTLLSGTLAWSLMRYLQHLALCQHLRLSTIPVSHFETSRPPALEYADLSVLGIEAILLTAFVSFSIRAVRRRRRAASAVM